jgi:uncharacterized integral membrane protein
MHKIKIAALILFAAFVALFILQNRGSVKTVWMFSSFELPLVLLLSLAMLAGFALGVVCAIEARPRPVKDDPEPGPKH